MGTVLATPDATGVPETPPPFGLLSIAPGVAVTDVVPQAQLKWPNDVQIGGTAPVPVSVLTGDGLPELRDRLTALADDPHHTDVGAGGRDWVRRHADLPAVARRYERLLRRVAGR